MNTNALHLQVNAIREKLIERAQFGMLGVVSAQTGIPEWMLRDWCDNAINMPGREDMVKIQEAVSEHVTVSTPEGDNPFREYQETAFKFAVYPGKAGGSLAMALSYTALGLNGEAGEVAEKVKKWIRDGKDFPTLKDQLTKELGDVLWYIAAMASELGVSLDEVARINIEKLANRKGRGTLHGEGDNR